MSRPLQPRPGIDNHITLPASASQRPKKISTACGACKARKTRCSGGRPCDACAARTSPCIYDAASDQRRKVANQRNIQDLETAHRDLDRHRELLGGMIATIKVGDSRANEDLITLIQSGVDLSQLAAHVRNELRSNLPIQHAFNSIVFIIDGPDELPSPAQILSRTPNVPEHILNRHPSNLVDEEEDAYDSLSNSGHVEGNMYGLDPTL